MYDISRHAKERYAERIMEKDDKTDVARFVIEHEEKIQTDINKMIEYGEEIFNGKQQRDGKKTNITVVSKDLWLILCDKAKNTVITLYKVDLCLGEDFNKEYVSRMKEKLNNALLNLENTKKEVEAENKYLKAIFEQNEYLINDYKSKINQLQQLNNAYKEVMSNNFVKIDIEESSVVEVVNSFIGKKEF